MVVGEQWVVLVLVRVENDSSVQTEQAIYDWIDNCIKKFDYRLSS